MSRHDPFGPGSEGLLDEPDISYEPLRKAVDDWLSGEIHDTINAESRGTARSQQQRKSVLGVSDIGHCRQYSALMIREIPRSDERDKISAWYGTILGDAIEKGLQKRHPEWVTQHRVVATLPSGRQLRGTPDAAKPFNPDNPADWQGVLDLKAKAELDTVKRNGQTQQQRFQLYLYALGLIQAGVLNPDHPIYLADVYYDRAAKGADYQRPYVISEIYDPAVLEEIEQWIEDVVYAVVNEEDASRDLPREFCASYCEFFTVCRGNDTDATGLIEDPHLINAVTLYEEGKKLKRDGERMQDNAKDALRGVKGSTGTHTVRWTHVDPTKIEGYVRAGYDKISITPVPKKKKG